MITRQAHMTQPPPPPPPPPKKKKLENLDCSNENNSDSLNDQYLSIDRL
jgi:hypothetical protein